MKKFISNLKKVSLKYVLARLFFPVPYPGAIITQIILGGIVAGLIGAAFLGYRGNGTLIPNIGAIMAVVLGPFVRKYIRS